MTKSEEARSRMIARMMREDKKLNPQERKRLLQHRAKRLLEEAGYGLKKKQDAFLVIDGESEEVLAEFESIEQVGKAFGFWGNDVPDTETENAGQWQKPPDRDETGTDTPETAAVREKLSMLP